MRILLTLVLLLALAAPAQAARPPVTAISTGLDHACALLADGTVKCWGANEHGQLGDGTRTRRLTAVTVRGIADAKAISAEFQNTCVVLSGGTVECWGANRYGQLGDGTKTTRALPAPVPGITDAIAVDSDYSTTCALLADRTVRCWGDNSMGGLGNGTLTSSLTPVVVSGLTDVVALSLHNGDGCALINGGTLSCWGWDGLLGQDRSGDILTPAPVAALTGVVAVQANAFNNCALLQSGDAECWQNSEAPKLVRGFGHMRAYGWSEDGQQTEHECALYATGTIKCRSPYPGFGQLGNGKLKNRGKAPVSVHRIHIAVALSVNDLYNCALLAGGTVRCWGANDDGQLGDGTRKLRPAPVSVRGL